jgi:hypothetical protein
MFNDKRHQPRVYYIEPKDCSLRCTEDHPWESASVFNLSGGGASIHVGNIVIQKGDATQIKIILGEEVIVPAVVVRKDEDVIGVSFGAIDEEVEALIDQEIINEATVFTDLV